MRYLLQNAESQTIDDASALIAAWDVQQDNARYKAAIKFIQAQSIIFSEVVRLNQIKGGFRL